MNERYTRHNGLAVSIEEANRYNKMLAAQRVRDTAPDLLAACEAAEKVLQHDPHDGTAHVVWKQLRAAIAKAKGTAHAQT